MDFQNNVKQILNVENYKAHLVARRHNQWYEVDYT